MNYKSVALELLSSDSFLVVNKKLIKKFGPNTAVFLSNLIDKYKYFQQKELLIDDGFFILRENLILEYGFTKRTILNCKTTLKNENIIKTKLIGAPPKEYYFIDWDNLLNQLDFHVTVKGYRNVTDNNIIITNNKKTNKITSSQRQLNLNFLENNKDNDSLKIKPDQFETFWGLYPRKTDKGKALTAWNKLCKKPQIEKPTLRQIRKSIIAQKETPRWKDPKFIPMPSTWINQSRWLDDPAEMIIFGRNNRGDYTGFEPMFDEMGKTGVKNGSEFGL